MTEQSDMRAIIEAARLGLGIEMLPTAADAVIAGTGPGGTREVFDLEAYHAAPRRKRGTVTVFDPDSFNFLIEQNRDAGEATIYIDRNPSAPRIVAVLNGNGEKGPGWGDFRVQLVFRETPQWKKWTGIDGKLLPQVQFAEFIEDNLEDIADPAPALMLEVATYLSITRSVDFKSAIRLSSGQVQFQNVENLDARVPTGAIAVPEKIALALAPFQGCDAFKVPARFRYRLDGGKLLLGVKLQRIEDLMRDVFDGVVNKIAVGNDCGAAMVEGSAP